MTATRASSPAFGLSLETYRKGRAMGAEIEITPEMLVAGVAVYEGLNWDQKLSDTVQASDHEIRQLVSKIYLAMAFLSVSQMAACA